jgi:23S rRNA (guanine745-N1)-methyltransferase
MATKQKIITCKNNHSFDISKSGYVNLLLSQQEKTKNHGDDKLMVTARQKFLNKGYYDILLNYVILTLKKYIRNNSNILDAGCGECFYTAKICEYLTENNINYNMLAVDISKDALSFAGKRNKKIELAVASLYHLPVKDNFCDIIFNFFAPLCLEEFDRIIKDDGIIIKIIPLEKHLMSLKKAIYDNCYENVIENYMLDGFNLIEKLEIKDVIHISDNEDILNLFKMTPYNYKTSYENKNRLDNLKELDCEIEFGILIYKKNKPIE